MKNSTKHSIYLAFACVLNVALTPAFADSVGYVTSRDLTVAEKTAVAKPVSLIALLANPEKYAGKIVAVKGFMHVQYEDQRLYLSRDDAEHLVRENALDVNFARRNLLLQTRTKTALPKDTEAAIRHFDRRFVLLIGKFSEANLDDVSRIMEL